MSESDGALHLGVDEYEAWIRSPYLDEAIAGDDATRLVVVHPAAATRDSLHLTAPGSLPVIVCWLGASLGDRGPAGADLVVGAGDLDRLLDATAGAPLASVALALLLRSQPGRTTDEGLVAESAVYSMLQAGPEFARWRAGDPRDPTATSTRHGPVVDIEREDGRLTITLNRPDRHNAITAQLRDELVDALALARSDDSIDDVVLRGNGPSFCSGGDLDEFGTRADPATAHVLRLSRSPGREIDRLGTVTVAVHGTTVGGGIEMAAFGAHVVADPSSTFSLPEITLGLIPGAGGTVSITRRIGRQRTAALGLTGTSIDTATALAWGLVDEISPR